ncbi:hypothetical protein PIB30_052329 [Stylosanthes scabra]|uniref:Uncharacterized protein n=1 Tax=Stylosanthes scabra TaxID=79078 RepID=A0ABU6XIQ4_9FABA|nr:hypothetical protein [Stylosanthes scabra]
MDRMDDQLSFLCYSNQMVNETMCYPYQNTARQFRGMEAQGVPVTIGTIKRFKRQHLKGQEKQTKAKQEKLCRIRKKKNPKKCTQVLQRNESLNPCVNLCSYVG